MKRKLSDELMTIIDQIECDDDAKKLLYGFSQKIDRAIDDIYRERTSMMSAGLVKLLGMQGDIKDIEVENISARLNLEKNKMIGRIMFSKKWTGTFSELLEMKNQKETAVS